MTLTGWSFIMFRTIDNSSPFAGIYFYLLVLVAAYFLVRGGQIARMEPEPDNRDTECNSP